MFRSVHAQNNIVNISNSQLSNDTIGIILTEFTELGPVPIASYSAQDFLTEPDLAIIATKAMTLMGMGTTLERKPYEEMRLYGPIPSAIPGILMFTSMFSLPFSEIELKEIKDPRLALSGATLTLVLLISETARDQGRLVTAALESTLRNHLIDFKNTCQLRKGLENNVIEKMYIESAQLMNSVKSKTPQWAIEKGDNKPRISIFTEEEILYTDLNDRKVLSEIHHRLTSDITSFKLAVPEFQLWESYAEGIILMYGLVRQKEYSYMIAAVWHDDIPEEEILFQKKLIEKTINTTKDYSVGNVTQRISDVINKAPKYQALNQNPRPSLLSRFFRIIFGSSRKNILVLGASGVGKTTMVQSMKMMLNEGRPLSEAEVERIQKTFGIEYDKFNFKGSQIEARDIAGDKSLYEKLYLEVLSVRDPDGVIYVVDPILDLNIQRENLEFTMRYLPNGVPVVVCMNKADMMSVTNASLFNPLRIAESFDFPHLAGKDSQYQIYQTSAITGRGVIDALEWMHSKS
ncbi:MAG: ADP-ribosylation factor-like protein [Promethearchaeota archaeon]